MKRKEDQFFEMFRESFNGFEPQVPDSVYSGIRNKMSWSKFLAFSATSLNIWYLALVVAGSAVLLVAGDSSSSFASEITNPKTNNLFVLPEVVEVGTIDENTVQSNVGLSQIAAQNIETTVVVKSRINKPEITTNPVIVASIPDENLAVKSTEEKSEHLGAVTNDAEPIEIIQASVIPAPYHLESTCDIVTRDILSQLQNDSKEIVSIDIIVQRPTTEE